MSAEPRVVVDDVRIRHEGAPAATPDGASLTVAPGEVVLLLGPSGSGKSTLALALNGLIPHAVPADLSGRLLVSGVPTSQRTVAELSVDVGMVFQDPDAQIVTGTLLDEVCFGPENLRVPVDEVLARAEHALRRVGLWERRGENPDRLSGGGRQRLAIACALALESPTIVLDEPTANLDPVGIEEVYAALRDVVAAGDRSIVLVEHNLDAAIDLVDRVVVLDRAGRLAMTGTTDDILRRRADDLLALGVWVPNAALAALKLRGAGVDLTPLPLTPRELAQGLDATDTLPAPVPTAATTSRAGTPIVAVRDLTVTRGRPATPILEHVTLDVHAGEFVALVGTNGAGKTTLLQAIAGVRRPPKGAITTAGLDPSTADTRTLARRVGFVFQNPEHQFIRHTVAEELAHALELQRLPAGDIEQQVDGMLARFGLTAHRDLHPFLLSGGQKRRLSVGTALIAGAPVLALDEPTFGQDRERAAELLDLLTQLVEEATTVLVVSHDMQLVADHASHIAVLRDGRLVGFDDAATVLASDLLDEAGLRSSPIAQATRTLTRHPEWRAVTRLRDVPGGVS